MIEKMQFDILTIFPEAFESFQKTSIIGRALLDKKIIINLFDIREFSENKHKKVDDVPYGGGAGMLMACQPIVSAIEYVKNLKKDKAKVIFFTPQGKVLKQEKVEIEANDFSRKILLCGHYEGIDQRIRDNWIDEEISIGEFVLTGGELPAQIFIDSISRLLPTVIGTEKSHLEDSFSQKLNRQKEYPHYTRPENFRGIKVPEVLISGHHANIEKWRIENLK